MLRPRVAEAAGADPPGVLLNWNHTHLAPPPSTRSLLARSGLLATDGDERVDAYGRAPARARGRAAAARRRAARAGRGGLGRRRGRPLASTAASAAPTAASSTAGAPTACSTGRSSRCRRGGATRARSRRVVGFGCHTVSAGMDFAALLGRLPRRAARRVRAVTGGECVFFQGAAGNVLPRISFCRGRARGRAHGRAAGARGGARAGRPPRLAAAPGAALRRLADPDAAVPLSSSDPGRGEALARRRAASSTSRCCRCRRATRSQAVLDQLRGRARARPWPRGAGPAELRRLGYHAKWARATLGRRRAPAQRRRAATGPCTPCASATA